MPLPVAVDDATKPHDTGAADYPASLGAAELRALKAKINNLFLATGVEADLPGLITLNGKGIYSNISLASANAIYGHAANVHRTGDTKATVGAQYQGYLADGVAGTDGVWGVIAAAISGSGGNSHGPLTGLEASVYARYDNNADRIRGVYIHFSDRIGAAAPLYGLGNNKYNFNSCAIEIDSDGRGSAGENCGFHDGLVFKEYSLDLANGVRGSAIDTYAIHYDGGGAPSTDYRVDAILRMRVGQSLVWDDGAGTKHRILGGGNTGPNIGFWENDTEKFAFDMPTGTAYFLALAGGGDRALRVDNSGRIYAV